MNRNSPGSKYRRTKTVATRHKEFGLSNLFCANCGCQSLWTEIDALVPDYYYICTTCSVALYGGGIMQCQLTSADQREHNETIQSLKEEPPL